MHEKLDFDDANRNPSRVRKRNDLKGGRNLKIKKIEDQEEAAYNYEYSYNSKFKLNKATEYNLIFKRKGPGKILKCTSFIF